MVRVLHLLSPREDFQTSRTADLLQRQLGQGFEVQRLQLSARPAAAAVAAAWRRLRPLRPGVDVVHAFGTPALLTASLAGAGRILFSPSPGRISQPSLRWLRAAMQSRNVQVIASSALQQRALLRAGIMPHRCQLIRPGVEFSRVVLRRRDPALRAALGLADDDFVLLAPGECTRASNHELAVWACGVLHVLDPRYKLLIWGQGPRTHVATTLARRLHQSAMLINATTRLSTSVPHEALTGAADAALVTARGQLPLLPIQLAMAAALPIVAVTNLATAELLEDRHTALLVSQPKARLLARRVLDLREDPELARSIADKARAEAFEHLSATRMLNGWRELYRGAAGEEPTSSTVRPAGCDLVNT